MTERELDALMPARIRRLAEDIFSRAVRYQTGHASTDYLKRTAADAIGAAKAFDREWQRQKVENDYLPADVEVLW